MEKCSSICKGPEAEISLLDRLTSGWKVLGAQEKQCQWCRTQAVF